jgi:hypothetical protein
VAGIADDKSVIVGSLTAAVAGVAGTEAGVALVVAGVAVGRWGCSGQGGQRNEAGAAVSVPVMWPGVSVMMSDMAVCLAGVADIVANVVSPLLVYATTLPTSYQINVGTARQDGQAAVAQYSMPAWQ